MSWSEDTDKLLQSGTVVVVKNFTSTFSSSSVYPVYASSTIETSTVLIFPKRGAFKKEIKGRVVESTHLLFFPATSSVAVGHRIFEPSETDFHEVWDVADYDGHKQVATEKVEKR
jgi:hypothetical protein